MKENVMHQEITVICISKIDFIIFCFDKCSAEKFMELSYVDQMPFIINLGPLSKLRIDHDKVIECEGGTGTLTFLISVVTYEIMKQL